MSCASVINGYGWKSCWEEATYGCDRKGIRRKTQLHQNFLIWQDNSIWAPSSPKDGVGHSTDPRKAAVGEEAELVSIMTANSPMLALWTVRRTRSEIWVRRTTYV